MSVDTPGSDEPEAEREYLNLLLRAVNLAKDNVINRPDRGITRLEQVKLCYFGIREFDLPVSYSWYLAGAHPYLHGDAAEAPQRMAVPGPYSRVDPGENEYVRRYRNYFESETFFDHYDLRAIWFTNRYEFLEDFYEEFAPEEFRDLYLTSTEIQRRLAELAGLVEIDSSNRTLSDFGTGTDVPIHSSSDEREFRMLVSDFHLELAEREKLSEIVPVITRSTDVLEQVMARLTSLGSASPEQKEALNRLQDYFYYTLWRYPALYISTQTAQGPNQHKIVKDHGETFLRFQETVLERRNELREECHDAGLYPDAGHHSEQADEEQLAHIHKMMRGVLEGSE